MLYGPWSLYAHVIVTTMPYWCIFDDFLYKDSKSVLSKKDEQFSTECFIYKYRQCHF